MGKRSDGVRGWRQWTEEQARGALEELAATGESVAAFARRKGISTQRVAYWRKRLAESTKPEFVAVALPATTPARWIEIAAAGVIVRVAEDLDADCVARVVEAIGRRVGGC
jgi:transposase-like protein